MGVKANTTSGIKLFDTAQSRRGHQDIPQRNFTHDVDFGVAVGCQNGDSIALRPGEASISDRLPCR